ncbi:MAG: hypothetical protein JXO22_14195 [Phycisphaerae bacterium]|nr:hypothetical protein [Phycisphaerae bacterium]
MALEPMETAHGSDCPCCVQLSVFLENRVGQLLRLTRLLQDHPVHILGMSVDALVDCSIVRMLFDDPDAAHGLLTSGGFTVAQTEVLVVEMPPGKRGIMTIFGTLIGGEVNINYLYPLIATESRPTCLAIHVDHLDQAGAALIQRKFRVLDQSDL